MEKNSKLPKSVQKIKHLMTSIEGMNRTRVSVMDYIDDPEALGEIIKHFKVKLVRLGSNNFATVRIGNVTIFGNEETTVHLWSNEFIAADFDSVAL